MKKQVIHVDTGGVTGIVSANPSRYDHIPAPKPPVVADAACCGALVLPLRRRISEPPMTESSPAPDDHAALIGAIALRRDRAAFAALFRFFAPRVKAWMLRAGAAPALAEELAQETMLAVWQKAALFDPEKAGASTWIFTIARNQRVDRLRRDRHPSELMADEPPEPARPDRIAIAAQAEGRIRAAMHALPPDQRTVVRKAFFEDKPHAAIEQELGIPLGTVKSRLRLAVGRLRAALGDLA